jgi:hypothetical protein
LYVFPIEINLRYFSEKVVPGVHDVAAKKEGFGVWKNEFSSLQQREAERRLRQKTKEREHAQELRRQQQMKQERAIHTKTRSDMLMKYFSEKVSQLGSEVGYNLVLVLRRIKFRKNFCKLGISSRRKFL